MPQIERKQSIYNLLKDFQGLEPLKELFWTELSYQRVNQSLSRGGWTETASKALADDPVLFASGGQEDDFHVIYARLTSDRLRLGDERPVVSRLLRDHPYALFVFSDVNQNKWHFLNVKYDEEATKRRMFRRITIGPEERLRTASERLALLDLEKLTDVSPLAIQTHHDEAFNVEAVTKQFFEEYQAVYYLLQDDLRRQSKDSYWAHDYALQFLNRCMFLYFIQRKGWLGDEREFLRLFWKSYRSSTQPRDSFVDKWLNCLFFEAFKNKYHGGHRHFPEMIKNVLAVAPFLNGGLFSENELDDLAGKYNAAIPDKRFEQIFKFLERYNFTIAEDSPLDQEVAVDPEMIGKVYESLVNVSEEADEKGDAGIFYTPRTEIDLMCRLALVDHLTNHLGTKHKSLLYQLVFALEPEEKEAADKECSQTKLWSPLYDRLNEITILDPACGSGSFLVGMLNILYDLQERAGSQLGKVEDPYDRKKRIIGQSLYGVDVMDWACHVAELRLWLSLIVNADLSPQRLRNPLEPLLPHFSFKIRCGDSLVQEIGDINLGHMRESYYISQPLKARVTKLKEGKLKFYNNEPVPPFTSVDSIKHEEFRLFRDILEDRAHKIQGQIRDIESEIKGRPTRQAALFGASEAQTPRQIELAIIEKQEQIDSLTSELDRIKRARTVLKTPQDVPFVWDIAFVEIFEGEKEGFDIVIGNPPYVERHKIQDPNSLYSSKQNNRKNYIQKLAKSVYDAFPKYFCLDISGRTSRSISAMSDLYIYFYFHGLSLLNSKGSFCFITSNSWLDVGYGKDLQEFLLKHCHVKMILDNQAKRSFASADVNTVIVLLSPPDDQREWAFEKMARFIMFKVPFEHIISPIIFDEIETALDSNTTLEYRIYPIQQGSLFKEGCEFLYSDSFEKSSSKQSLSPGLIKLSKYIGDKWGGKYLRAPNIYHIIRKKGSMVPINHYATARLGVTTGANEFFFIKQLAKGKYITTLGSAETEITFPEIFTKPVIRTVSECANISFRASAASWRIVTLPEKVTDRKALEYIKLGEQKGIPKRPFFHNKKLWYSLSFLPTDIIAVPEIISSRYFFLWNQDSCILNKNFYGFVPKKQDIFLIWGLLNCSYSFLQFELCGRKPGAGASGISVDIANRILVASVNSIGATDQQAIILAGRSLLSAPIREIWDDVVSEERRSLDGIIFDILGLTQGEREAVCEAAINLVEARLKKAKSLNSKASGKRIEEDDE